MSKFDDIRLILLRNWDPIGVTSFSSYNEATEDEYDGYARSLDRMIGDGASEPSLLSYLKWAEETNMGLSFEEERARKIVVLLLTSE